MAVYGVLMFCLRNSLPSAECGGIPRDAPEQRQSVLSLGAMGKIAWRQIERFLARGCHENAALRHLVPRTAVTHGMESDADSGQFSSDVVSIRCYVFSGTSSI